MRALIVNCSPVRTGATAEIVHIVSEELVHRYDVKSVCIDDYAFSFCTEMTNVTLPSGITVINEGMFSCCYELKTIEIPNSVTSIGAYAFSGCKEFTSITIPNNVTTINRSAFNSCNNLTTITIPISLTYIGDYAFEHCTSLVEIISLANVAPTLGNKVFRYLPQKGFVYVPINNSGYVEKWANELPNGWMFPSMVI